MLPVLIVGAGISGLCLAQQLRKVNVPYLVFERVDDFETRGPGWGLTLTWSLPALREILPEDLLAKLPSIYVNRDAVEQGKSSKFPFFDLSTGELKGSSPAASVDQRVRVTRQRFRELLATGVDIQWGKSFRSFHEGNQSVTAVFEDGSEYQGRLIVGCDGSHSRVRRALYPDAYTNYQIPVRMLGFTMRVTPDQANPIGNLDPFFLQGTASANDTFMYISLLEAPNDVGMNGEQSDQSYHYQTCISWNKSKPPFDDAPDADTGSIEARIEFIRKLAYQWAEPFRSFVLHIPDTADVKQIDLDDFVPDTELRFPGRVLLAGDAFHAMAMYRGEGANHAIVDVQDMQAKLLPQLLHADGENTAASLYNFSSGAIKRTRPSVLASRRACLDAHDWHALTPQSPLLSKRAMMIEFDEHA